MSGLGDRLASIAAVRRTDPARLTRLVRGDLDWIVMKCLEKDRNRRYDTALGLVHDLERYMSDEPVTASPPSVWYRLSKYARRNRATIAGVIIALVAAVSLAYSAVSMNYQRKLVSVNQRLFQAEDNLQQVLYCGRVASSLQEWHNNEAGRTKTMLAECPVERRHWEWHYVDQLCHSERLSFKGHTDHVFAVAYSPDGKRVASASLDDTIIIWDAGNADPLLTLKGHSGRIVSVAFHPDGQRVATGGDDSTIKLWDVETGKQLSTLKGHENGVSQRSVQH